MLRDVSASGRKPGKSAYSQVSERCPGSQCPLQTQITAWITRFFSVPALRGWPMQEELSYTWPQPIYDSNINCSSSLALTSPLAHLIGRYHQWIHFFLWKLNIKPMVPFPSPTEAAKIWNVHIKYFRIATQKCTDSNQGRSSVFDSLQVWAKGLLNTLARCQKKKIRKRKSH